MSKVWRKLRPISCPYLDHAKTHPGLSMQTPPSGGPGFLFCGKVVFTLTRKTEELFLAGEEARGPGSKSARPQLYLGSGEC